MIEHVGALKGAGILKIDARGFVEFIHAIEERAKSERLGHASDSDSMASFVSSFSAGSFG